MPHYNREQIGQRLRAARESRGWSLRQMERIARHNGLVLPYNLICRYETGNKIPRLDTFMKLCEALHLEPGVILAP